MYQLRPYQAEAKKAVLEEWQHGNKKALLVLPTGCGKTIVFASIAEEQVRRGRRVLIMAHRDELLSQAADKLKAACGLETVLEKAESTGLGSSIPVTVGSVQSLTREARLARFPEDYFDAIIVDEAHHCLSDSYQRVLGHFPQANVLGVTATPDRGDMKDLGTYFDCLAYEYSLIDAVKAGYLCPIKAQMIPLKLDLTGVRSRCGDYRDEDLGNALEPYLGQIADEMVKACRGRRTLVFLPLISTSQKFCDILTDRGLRAAEVNGMSPDRKEVLADFEAGRYDVLCNSMLLTEGWDCPSLDCIVVLRPTKIRSLYVQMVGRGTRTSPGKDDLLLLDFLWLTSKHNLCRPSALVGRTDSDKERIDRIVAKGPVGILEASDMAEEAKAEEARQAALAEALRANRTKKRATVNPLDLAPFLNKKLIDWEPSFKWESDKPTDKQIKLLEKYGIDTKKVTTKGYASALIGSLIGRSKSGLATAKQISFLMTLGYMGDTSELTMSQASELIDDYKGKKRA